MKIEIVQRSQTISEFVTYIDKKYLNIGSMNLGIEVGNKNLERWEQFNDIKNNAVINFYRCSINYYLLISLRCGKIIKIYVEPSETVDSVKEKIYHFTQIIPDEQRLIYERKQLEDGRTLSDYNIKSGDQIHLIERKRGGCFPGFAPIKTSPDTIK